MRKRKEKKGKEKRKKWKNKSGKVVWIRKITWIGTKKQRDIEVVLRIHEYYYYFFCFLFFNSEFLVTWNK